jgi:hypothetical protein
VFRDPVTDFLFSQVPTTGFAAFKPPIPSPNRTKFLPAAIDQPHVSSAIPPPPVPIKSLGGKKQLGVRARACRSLPTASSAVSPPSSAAAAPAKAADESKLQASHASLGQKRERDGEVKQVTFAATECPRPLPARPTAAAASAPRATPLAAAKPDSFKIAPVAPIASVLNFSPPAASPQPANNSSAAPTTKIPAPSLLSVQGTQRTYGKGHRPPAPAVQPVVLPSSATRPHPVLQSPSKPVPHDQQHALNNTPGKDSATAAAAAAAITPNTEPRVSRCRGSGTALTAQCAA